MAPFPDLTKFQDLIPILVFLLPGFVTSGIVSLLAVRKPQEAFGRTVEAVIFTALNLFVFFIAKEVLSHLASQNVTFRHVFAIDGHHFFTAENLTLLGLCALGIGLVWSIEANNEFIFRVLRWAKVTSKTTKHSVWLDVFSRPDIKPYVTVRLKDGKRLVGYVKHYSDDAADRVLYLEQASWLTPKNVHLNNPPIEVLLDQESGISWIEILNSPNKSAPRSETNGSTAKPLTRSDPGARTIWFWFWVVVGISYFFWERRIRRRGPIFCTRLPPG
jgi:uncharacterized protein DUF6338